VPNQPKFLLAPLSYLILAAMLGVASARPAPDPAAVCAAAKLMAGGVGAQAALACHMRAAAGGLPVNAACLTGADRRVAAAFVRAERRGGCATTGDAGGISGRLNRHAAAAAVALRPMTGRSKCASSELRAIGIGTTAFLRARAKYGMRFDREQFDASRAVARARLLRAFRAAVRKPGCLTKDPANATNYAERLAGLAGPLRARLEGTKLVLIEPSARGEILAKRAQIEALGFSVADDGAVLNGATSPLGGWLAVVGTARGRSLADDGIVTLDVPADAPFEGSIHHPADDDFVTGPVYLPDLAAEGETLQTLTFEVRNHGPCGMNPNSGDDSNQCHASATGRSHGRQRSALNPDPGQFPAKVTRELGTYPNDAPGTAQVACLDYDGLIESHTERGSTSDTGIIAYPGSTCYIQVELGCCDNEAADIRRKLAREVFGPREYPVLHCPANHKGGRFCQSITKGDVSLRVRGDILKAGATGSYEVAAGENVPITVHNNGCYGDTHVTDGIIASVLPLGGHLTGTALEGGTIKHYQQLVGGGSGANLPDRDIAYAAPSPCPTDQLSAVRSDEYSFETDGSTVGVRFRCTPTTTTTLPCRPGARAGTCEIPIIDYVGTSQHRFDEEGQNFSHHNAASASFTLTNDPLIRNGNGDEDTFVVKSGSVTYSETNTDGGCTTTVAETTVSLTPFPGGIPSAMIIARPPGVEPFVTAGFVEAVPVTERTSCPPNPPVDTQDSASAGYLVIPLFPTFRLELGEQVIAGTFQPDARESYEWRMTRVER
jgi:hypothetical protein